MFTSLNYFAAVGKRRLFTLAEIRDFPLIYPIYRKVLKIYIGALRFSCLL
jgi:hypothetical protein